jgi:hypothetical protein
MHILFNFLSSFEQLKYYKNMPVLLKWCQCKVVCGAIVYIQYLKPDLYVSYKDSLCDFGFETYKSSSGNISNKQALVEKSIQFNDFCAVLKSPS